MSLIIDLLKKINKNKKELKSKASVYPSLKDKDEGKKKKNILPVLIGAFIVFTFVSAFAVYYLNNYITIDKVSLIKQNYNKESTVETKIVKENVENKRSKEAPKTVKTLNQSQNKKNINTKEEEETKEKAPATAPPIKIKSENPIPKIPNINILLTQANYYLSVEDYEKALNLYNTIIKYKSNEEIVNNIVILLIRTNHIDDILNYSNQINENIAANAVLELIKLNRVNTALNILNGLQKKGKSLYLAYGLVYEAMGNLNRAEKFYAKAYQINPYNPKSGYYYARFMEINGNYKKALQIYKSIFKFIRESPMKKIIKNRIEILEKIVG